MEKCRICLANHSKTLSIYERIQNISYVDIITSVANVKIFGDDSVTDKICRSCSKKLREFHEFKLLIERSDAILNQISNSKLKRINFKNLSEVIDITQIKQEHDVKENIQDLVTNFSNGKNIATYNNIVVKRVKSLCDKGLKMPMSKADFLANFSVDGENDDDNYFYEIYDDDAQTDNDETFLDDDLNTQDYFEDTEDIPLSLRIRTDNTNGRKVNEKRRKFVKKYDKHSKNDDCVEDTEDIPLLLRMRNNKTHERKVNEKRRKIDKKYDKDNDIDEDYVPCKSDKPKSYNKQNYAKDNESDKLTLSSGTTPKFRIRPKISHDLRVIRAKSALPIKRKPVKRKEKSKICPHCGKCFINMSVHILSHGERQYACYVCNKAFFTAATLKTHMDTHSDKRLYKCDECVATFSTKRNLNHHKIHHIDKDKRPQFTCAICTKKFTNKRHLSRHVLIHNSANKTVKCELCEMSFYDKFGLKHHMRVHTGERPYKCELCSQPYSYKHDFNRHCFKKHGVFLKRRLVNVMNEEVLVKERKNMRELVLRANGLCSDGAPNLFENEGNSAWLAIDQAMKDLKRKKIDFSDLI